MNGQGLGGQHLPGWLPEEQEQKQPSGAIDKLYHSAILAEFFAKHPENQGGSPLDNLSKEDQAVWDEWMRNPMLFEETKQSGDLNTVHGIQRDQMEWGDAVSSFSDSVGTSIALKGEGMDPSWVSHPDEETRGRVAKHFQPTLRDKLGYIEQSGEFPGFKPGWIDMINMWLGR